jgi:hypothetical protein
MRHLSQAVATLEPGRAVATHMSASGPEAADPACLLHVRSCGVKRTRYAKRRETGKE